MKRLALALLMLIPLAACAGAPVGSSGNTALSPREQADTVMQTYAAVQTAALAAVTSPLLASNATVKSQIKASTHAATDAVLGYADQARRCYRDQATGTVGDATGLPAGVHCDPSALGAALAVANSALATSTGLLTAFGFPPATAAPAAAPATTSS